jgi:hypothetical protein
VANQIDSTVTADRLSDLRRFYKLLERLEEKSGGRRRLGEFTKTECPLRGVYFFFGPEEDRSDSGLGVRVTRVGKHDDPRNNRDTSLNKCRPLSPLWERIKDHGWGSRENSQFRQLVGAAIIKHHKLDIPSWSFDTRNKAAKNLNTPKTEINVIEDQIEGEINVYMRSMSILCLAVDYESDRRQIESNSIALLSNYGCFEKFDPPSESWLGHHSDGGKRVYHRDKVRGSGLWCIYHVYKEPAQRRRMKKGYDPNFLDVLADYIKLHPAGSHGTQVIFQNRLLSDSDMTVGRLA